MSHTASANIFTGCVLWSSSEAGTRWRSVSTLLCKQELGFYLIYSLEEIYLDLTIIFTVLTTKEQKSFRVIMTFFDSPQVPEVQLRL